MHTRWRALAAGVVLFCTFLAVPPLGAYESASTAHKTLIAPPPEARVDLNHASLDELLKVPGMTHTWAGRIIRFRPYHAKNELLIRGVVTSEVYDRIKDYVIAHRDNR